MRISTVGFQNDALAQMQALETDISQTQSQLSTGLQLQNAADNPSGMAQVNELNVELSASQQYVTNGQAASANMTLEEQALTEATNVLQSAQSLAVQANNTSLSVSERQNIATQLQQQLQQLVGIANSTDSNGNYLFGGYASGTQPFSQSGNSVTYSGADSVDQIQISADQRISGGDTGASVFMNIPAGNGTFTTAAAAGNTGTASIDAGSVTNLSAWVPGTYTIAFTSPTQYQVTNAADTVVASGTYTSPGTIAFDGVQVTVSGTPATGDKFAVTPAGTASAFSTLSNLITTLNSTTLNAGQLTTQISGALEQIGNAVTNIDNVQASVGARLDAITSSQSTAQSEQTDMQTSISQLSDVDYAAAVTQLNTEEVSLQAAQESYASLSKLSLFNYLS
jgi:flagellar hook-associated protein 3 FlgL